MAVFRCPACKGRIGPETTTCPYCGQAVRAASANQAGKAITRLIWFMVPAVILIAVGVILMNNTGSREDGLSEVHADAPSRSTSAAPSPSIADVPSHEIVDRDIYDAPVKTQVELHAVLRQSVTESDLDSLLQKLYTDALATGGFKHHGGKPTHIFIYVYTTREHFASGMGQWIAMLSKTGENAQASTRIKSELIPEASKPP